MAGIVDQVLLNIQATVTGAQSVAQLTGNIGGLATKVVALNSGIQIIQQLTAAITQMGDQAGKYAQMADGAAVAARSWQIVLERFGLDAEKTEARIQALSDRTGAAVPSLKDAAAQYIKMGGSLLITA